MMLQLYVLKRLLVTLGYELSTIKVVMKLHATTTKMSCSILAYLVSAGVKLLDVNATGLLLPWLSFCMRTAPSPTFDASTCSVTGLVMSKYCRQAAWMTAFQFLKVFLMAICPLKKNTSSGVS